MKVILQFVLALGFAALCTVGCTDHNSYIVTGKDTSGRCPDGEWAYLCVQRNSPNDHHFIDSVKIANNSFRFEGKAERPTIAFVMTSVYDDSVRLENPMIAHCFILENGKINVASEDGIPTPSGTPLNEKVTMFAKEFVQTFISSEEENQNDEEERLEKAFSLVKRYVTNNADNEFGVFAVDYTTGLFGPKKELEILLLLHDKQDYFAELIGYYRQASAIQIGSPYIDVAEPAVDGKMISLKSVVEKAGNRYILLEFWASWCNPCMSEMPNLKATYDKYHKRGFEVYASSLDSNKANWQAAMAKFEMKWICVSGLSGGDSVAPKAYMISSIPSNFLIECSTGKIIAKNLRGEALGEKLEELLK